MAKYEERFKLKVVRSYLSNHGGWKTVGQLHGLDQSTVRRWVASYGAHGLAGLKRKGASYDAAFKLLVLQRMWRDELSTRQAAALFDIRCAAHISKWERQYHVGGLVALTARRGRPKKMITEPPKPTEPLADEAQTLAQLRKENEYLRAENAYLKKLDALIQQKQADARKKRKS